MTKKIEEMTFDEAIDELEDILSELQDVTANTGSNMSAEDIDSKLNRAEELKDYCKKLLEKEREDIIRTAKENNIPLDEIGLDEDSLDIEFEKDDATEEE